MHPKRLFGILYAIGLALLIWYGIRSLPEDPIGAFGFWLSTVSSKE